MHRNLRVSLINVAAYMNSPALLHIIKKIVKQPYADAKYWEIMDKLAHCKNTPREEMQFCVTLSAEGAVQVKLANLNFSTQK